MPWECLRNCLLPSKNVMCRQDSLFPLSSLTAFGGFASKSPQLCIFFFFLYHSHESLLVVIWFCGWFICSRKGEVVSGSFSQSSLAAGAATGQRAISSKMKCHVLSPCSTHTNKHTHTRANSSPMKWDNTTIWSSKPLSLPSLSALFPFSFIYRGCLAPWQSRSIHYVPPLFNLVGKFNFQMNTVLF